MPSGRNGYVKGMTTTPTAGTYESWHDRMVYDQDGDKIGKIDTVYYDEVTGRPEWISVNTGLFGGRNTFVPISGLTGYGDDMRVPYTKDFVKDAPNVGDDGYLTSEQTRALFDHYDLSYAGTDRESIYGTRERMDKDYRLQPMGDTQTMTGTQRREEVVEEVPVHEERVQKETVEHKARLKKYIITEHVPVTREEVRMEVDPDTPTTDTTTTSRTSSTRTQRDA